VDVSRVILFGSFAKGYYHSDSDIDTVVVLKNDTNHQNIQLDLVSLRRNIDSRMEPHPFVESDFNTSSPLVHEILNYGVEFA